MARRIIAVVDDDYRLLESLESLLASAGYSVQLFLSARDFLDAGALEEVDCLITDVGMPGMDGYTLIDQIRSRRPDFPVMLITGREQIAGANTPFTVSSDRFFMKPFDGKRLLAAISEAL